MLTPYKAPRCKQIPRVDYSYLDWWMWLDKSKGLAATNKCTSCQVVITTISLVPIIHVLCSSLSWRHHQNTKFSTDSHSHIQMYLIKYELSEFPYGGHVRQLKTTPISAWFIAIDQSPGWLHEPLILDEIHALYKSDQASGITLYTTNVCTYEHEIKHQVTKLVLVQDSYHKNF